MEGRGLMPDWMAGWLESFGTMSPQRSYLLKSAHPRFRWDSNAVSQAQERFDAQQTFDRQIGWLFETMGKREAMDWMRKRLQLAEEWE